MVPKEVFEQSVTKKMAPDQFASFRPLLQDFLKSLAQLAPANKINQKYVVWCQVGVHSDQK